ncbi:MAG TPA: elongation factor G [Phycisphaerae bacterium]|jgi:elongation factor G|nr:elongation factor G [Phycisphaerae bacterium]HOB72967.1 elongation factor G [Phycisphaerae bacterium]HOJ52984.1 elongation factor G [Phycisphaerae bacterium]HOL24721.1 elongation factor G [Phycisphaerae bacterium]HPP19257.1 elongation factor G [Phycisphaerae bacterium]
MPSYTTADIRNIALVGHQSAGKTSLADAMMHVTGAVNRLGDVNAKNSHLDFMEEEKSRGCSIDSHLAFVTAKGKTINVVDTPGAPDFIGPAIASLAGVETAVCVISATAGIEVNTRRMMERAKEFGLGRMIVINKIDANLELDALIGGIQELFGHECQPMNLPTNKGAGVIDCFLNKEGTADFSDVATVHTALIERIVEADEALMEEYLSTGDIDPEKLGGVVAKAIAAGSFVPILFTNARGEVGVKELLEIIADFAPSPLEGKQRSLGETPIQLDPAGKFVGQVFKLFADPRSNIKYSVCRVHSGTLKADSSIYIGAERKAQRPGSLYKLQGAEHPEIDAAIPGDIVAMAKLDTSIGDVLHSGDEAGTIEMPKFPHPMYALAIEPKSRGDADKVSGALHKFTEEDPCFIADRDPQTGELVIHGIGDLHLRSILSRMQQYFKLEVNTKPPKVPYRETITGSVKDIEYTHKKQTGGAGQFGRVVIALEPNERGKGYEFIDEIFGGAIDLSFRPSVDKGIQAQLKEGVLAGYPVVDVKVRLTDGKTHPVDSKDIAFQIAGREAFKIAFMQCKPVLLEPIVNLEVTVPNDKVGDIQGDLASRRGRPTGQTMLPGGLSIITGQVPLAEMSDYHSRLSSITGGQGSYTMELSHYEAVPGNVQQQIIEKAKKEREEARAAH